MLKKYLFKMGNTETYIYEEFIHELADDNNGTLTLDTIQHALEVLGRYGDKYWSSIDSLALLQYFMNRENVTSAHVIEKSEGL